ncbi:MAG: extracellular solute-binding protein [Microbacterium sp.]
MSTDIDAKASTMSIMVASDNVDNIEQLVAGFEEEHPNVTVEIRSDSFANLQANAPRIMAGADAPDLMYLPTLGNTVKDDLILNLDDYAAAYGWDEFPARQLEGMRVGEDGTTKGDGSLYSMGMGYTMTGLYYNVRLARQAGIESAPRTLAEFEAALEKAKSSGVTPLISSGKDATVFYIFQSLLQDRIGSQSVTDWIYDKPEATIDNDGAVQAAQTLQDWAQAGYLASDINSLDGTAAAAAFAAGEGIFFASGNWNNATLASSLGEDVAFIPFPGATETTPVGLSDATAYAIPTKADNPNAAAGFLNWVNNSETGRSLVVTVSGLIPGGDTESADGATTPLTGQILDAFASVESGNGFAPFMGNATASIYSNTLTPQLQLLLAGKTTAEDFVGKVQSDYESQLGR